MSSDSPAPPPAPESNGPLAAYPPPSPTKTFLASLGLLALGLLVCWIAVWDPLQDARKGVRSVSYSLKGALVGPLLVFMGMASLFLRSALGIGPGQRPNALGWVVIALGIAAGIAVAWWFDAELARLGYRRS